MRAALLQCCGRVCPQPLDQHPADSGIAHVNIFRAMQCPLLGRPFPYLCWGTYPNQWAQADPAQRTLLTLLENVLQHLNHPNFASRAR